MDLFEHGRKQSQRSLTPLADRMRPRRLEEFVGQDHLIGEGKFLRTLLERDELPSMIFWGPPGTGKTTLASIIAHKTQSRFVPFSGVHGSVKDIRAISEKAKGERGYYGKRTLVFVDEIHRMNKAQQDSFLPFVEDGTFVLIGATTENPSFSVNAALLSRSRVLTLHALEAEDIANLLQRALTDEERGLARRVSADTEALEMLAEQSWGDARRALTALETCDGLVGEGGTITEDTVREALQQKTLIYDKSGDEHYNVISAFIKSMRGSDPDAALYYMSRMLESGEDPLFILRRIVIFASEDIGNADPRALQVAMSATDAFRFLGLPEGAICMSQAVTYCATAPKSNASYAAYGQAKADVKQYGPLAVPMHLRNAPTKLMKNLGYGDNYKYPHNYEGNYVSETYLPEQLADRLYYQPFQSGYEGRIKERLDAWRERKKGSSEA